MEPEKFEIKPEFLKELDDEFPQADRAKPGTTGLRAERIVKRYLENECPGCKVTLAGSDKGADLILEKPNGREELIEVKGTAAKHMAWGQLVVSSQNSHDRLTLERIKMYRVTHVFESAVFIYILTHSEHFDLKLEPRWKVKEIKGEQVIESLVAANSAGRKSKCRNRTNYELFYQYLGDRDDELVRLNLDEIEEILGDKLKKWAKDPTFWVPTRSFAKRCADAGYAIRQKNLKTRPFWVEFKRIA